MHICVSFHATAVIQISKPAHWKHTSAEIDACVMLNLWLCLATFPFDIFAVIFGAILLLIDRWIRRATLHARAWGRWRWTDEHYHPVHWLHTPSLAQPHGYPAYPCTSCYNTGTTIMSTTWYTSCRDIHCCIYNCMYEQLCTIPVATGKTLIQKQIIITDNICIMWDE